MVDGAPSVGREREQALLSQLARDARARRGSIVLIAGEAGAGKTSLLRGVLDRAGLARVDGFGVRGAPAPWAPIRDVLRGLGALSDCDDPPTAFAAALSTAATHSPLAVVLDDMQWADTDTLATLPGLARALSAQPLLLAVAYRNDELTRAHPIRRLRDDLRRDDRLCEVVLGPLALDEVTALLAHASGAAPPPSLTDVVHALTGGNPFFVAELAAVLATIGWPAAGEALPIPERVRDAILLRAAGLSAESRRRLDAGTVDDRELAPGGAADELLAHGLLRETAPGRALTFSHAIVRETIHREIPESRRRALHDRVASRLQREGAPSAAVAEHQLLAGATDAARRSFLAAADTALAARAHHDAAGLAARVLELAAGDREARVEALRRLAASAELAGDAPAAAQLWCEVAEAGDPVPPHRRGEAWRRRAAALELDGHWEEALASREAAADAFAAAGAFAESVAERLAAAIHLRSAASFRAALSVLELAARDEQRAGRADLRLRIRGLEGNLYARMGDGSRGVKIVRDALAEALGADLGPVAAEIYQRLADSLEHGGDYATARETYDEAAAFCSAMGATPVAELCLACLAVVLRQAGDWTRALAVGGEVLSSAVAATHSRAAAGCTVGVIHALRGEVTLARGPLLEARSAAVRIELVAAEILSIWGLAVLDDVRDAPQRAAERARLLLRRWEQTEERHYAVAPLRWAATLLAQVGDTEGAHRCASALARIAADVGHAEAQSGLAHALGEVAILDGDGERAVIQFRRAIDLLDELGAPFERMESERRAAAALLGCDRREEAVERLLCAYRLARRLRAQPSVRRLAAELAGLGEPADRRLSRRAAEQLVHEQLTRRELEVVRLLARGATNREIAADLYLSVRTVDMHVRNVLRKLGCRSRTDAALRAGALGLLAAQTR